MLRENEQYIDFHIWIHEAGSFTLFLDNEDKDQFLAILAYALEEFYSNMFAFDLMDTHYHYYFGLKHESRTTPDPAWLKERVRKCVELVNRRYGKHYRQKYGFHGELFKRYDYCAKRTLTQKDFQAMMRYVQMNSLAAKKFEAIEDDPYNSFAYYLAAYFNNPEFQQLPTVRKIATSPASLRVFDMLDLAHTIKQYDADFHLGALGFAKHMINAQKSFRNASPQRLSQLGLSQLYHQPERIHFEKTDGHQVMRFISALNGNNNELRTGDSIGNSEHFRFAEENPILHFETFLRLCQIPFVAGDNSSLQAAFQSIRKNFETQYNAFVRAMSSRVSHRKLCQSLGLNVYSLNQIISEKGNCKK
ncbi:MAG: hypothetical protein WCL54_07105 [Clostridia bacterium]